MIVGTIVVAVLWGAAMLWNREMLASVLCYPSLIIVFGALPGLALLNLYPTVWVEDTGLYVSYNLNHRAFVPWKEIIQVKKAFPPSSGDLVITRQLTPLHRIYGGWQLGISLRPSFLIGPRTRKREELLQIIQERISN